MARARHFTVMLNTKPYLAKYITSKYGHPIILDNCSLIGVVLFSLLQKKVLTHYDISQKHIALRSFTTSLQFLAPYKRMHSFGVDISDDHIIQINRYFDDEFEETLHIFVQRFIGDTDERYKGYKEAIEAFCTLYGISIEEDISFDGLKKCEYRFRKKREAALKQVQEQGIEIVHNVNTYSAREKNLANSVPSIISALEKTLANSVPSISDQLVKALTEALPKIGGLLQKTLANSVPSIIGEVQKTLANSVPSKSDVPAPTLFE